MLRNLLIVVAHHSNSLARDFAEFLQCLVATHCREIVCAENGVWLAPVLHQFERRRTAARWQKVPFDNQ